MEYNPQKLGVILKKKTQIIKNYLHIYKKG